MVILSFLKYVYKNYYTHIAIFILLVSGFAELLLPMLPRLYFHLAILSSSIFFLFAILQEWSFFNNHRVYQYKDAANVLIITKKIEKAFERLGGTGKGMYEKAFSVFELLPDGMLDNIMKLAEIRNSAVHGNPNIPNAQDVLQDATLLLKKVQQIRSSKKININLILTLIIKSLIISIFLFTITKNAYMYKGIGAAILGSIITYYIAKAIYAYRVQTAHAVWLLLLLTGGNIFIYLHKGYTSLVVYFQDVSHYMASVITLLFRSAS